MCRALVDPQKKDLRSNHDLQKDPFNNSQRNIILVQLLEGDAL